MIWMDSINEMTALSENRSFPSHPRRWGLKARRRKGTSATTSDTNAIHGQALAQDANPLSTHGSSDVRVQHAHGQPRPVTISRFRVIARRGTTDAGSSHGEATGHGEQERLAARRPYRSAPEW